ncbi:MAG: hydroxylamine reductase [Spirochaetia bacterium]
MFCYQCEQTSGGAGCEVSGVCGKKPDVAALQDLIVYQLKGIGWLAHQVYGVGASPREVFHAEVCRYTVEALFTTVTNVNFDPERLVEVISQGKQIRGELSEVCRHARALDSFPQAAQYTPPIDSAEMVKEGSARGVLADSQDEDIRSLRQLLVYGLKGMAAYADHALVLGKTDDSIFAFMHEALAALALEGKNQPGIEELVGLCMRCGEVNVRAMALLDEAHTSHFGHPAPAAVSTGTRKGPAIVVSGHDLLDLEALLEQTQGTGVNVYTHGEMLPAHGYPGLRKFSHLAGHFGTAWQNQQKEFDGQPAAFLFTTNCIQKPRESYKDRVFTTGLVAFPGVAHAKNRDFSAIIERAKALGGFSETKGITLTTGFGHNAVLSVADKVVAAVKSGAIRRFFLVGGCDGAKPGRNYYTELAEKAPKDTVILTLACGKFRLNHLELGSINGIPRLLDVGQCNDAYSAVVIAQALAKAFGCGLNDLPLNLILSWYEQKAVVILLSLLSLGIKGIRIGPSLPAFISPNILKFLVEKFDLKPIGTAEGDLQAILA